MTTEAEMKTMVKQPIRVYLDTSEDTVLIYRHDEGKIDTNLWITIPVYSGFETYSEKIVFKKQGLDVDITSILMKYRMPAYGMPAQLTTDLNMAVYAGWRFDSFHVNVRQDPLGKKQRRISERGFDFGFFAGPGSTLLSPFTTLNRRVDEYNGMIIQAGLAGFIESNIASFGIALGYDYLLGKDRSIWIYNQKPWLGFVVGIALN